MRAMMAEHMEMQKHGPTGEGALSLSPWTIAVTSCMVDVAVVRRMCAAS